MKKNFALELYEEVNYYKYVQQELNNHFLKTVNQENNNNYSEMQIVKNLNKIGFDETYLLRLKEKHQDKEKIFKILITAIQIRSNCNKNYFIDYKIIKEYVDIKFLYFYGKSKENHETLICSVKELVAKKNKDGQLVKTNLTSFIFSIFQNILFKCRKSNEERVEIIIDLSSVDFLKLIEGDEKKPEIDTKNQTSEDVKAVSQPPVNNFATLKSKIELFLQKVTDEKLDIFSDYINKLVIVNGGFMVNTILKSICFMFKFKHEFFGKIWVLSDYNELIEYWEVTEIPFDLSK